ncbi:Uncharacterized protein conserved in bacteria, putative virulence factor [Serratia quinivorans]|uniref:virulence factor SrfB n=1 Tax=Serratia quinivorans TaxID=137545 RepID=UPI00217A6B94|nr:virulence factor SrfB [Serratia quinivorans]CAI1614290.1 Uncharacterized protein conserved in bacteria, putative virulence factor [Serratia quinivorans]
MLAPLTDYPRSMTLVQDSGIQFLDFALTPVLDDEFPGKFVRQTASGPLLRLQWDADSGKYLLPAQPGQSAEVVRPEFSHSLQQSLQLLNKTWLPLPFFRCTSSGVFLSGPDNWARMQTLLLDSPDQDGNLLRVVLAFDTRLAAAGQEALAPGESDINTGIGFSLGHQNHELGEFLDLTWVDSWLREVFSQSASSLELRSDMEINAGLKTFEYQAHYLNLLNLLGSQLTLPQIKIIGETPQQPAINVDLILDVGNSHTCGVMVEDHPQENNGLKQTNELQLRSLSAPHCVYNELFESRVEFAQASFGKPHLSYQSGRDDAFVWPSIVRVGREAAQLALRREGTEGTTGISSPRRYLWDEERYAPGWRFNSQQEPMAAAAPLSSLLNDEGVPLSALPVEERLPVFAAHYSRSAVMALMLTELLAQALMQINTAAQRTRMPNTAAPRRLRTIILTLPSAMPKPEREIFRRRMQEAIGLIWKAMGWHPLDAPFSAEQARMPVPLVHMEWDEATCGQMVYLYNETQVNFAGRTDAFFAAMARPDRPPVPGEQPGKSLRIASIDIGGGTTDLAITQYRLDDGVGNNIKINPRLLFREGFKLAGDDILLDVIGQFILPAVQQAFEQAGVSATAATMDKLFGNQGRMDGFSTLRQQATLQIFMPAGRALLSAYEDYDPLDSHAEIAATLGELLPQMPTLQVLAFINDEVQRGSGNAAFDILQTPLVIRLGAVHAAFLSDRIGISHCLRLLCEVVALYSCDVLLLTGRPACFPGVQALLRHLQPLPASRILPLDGYHTRSWYPFNQGGRIDNPKSTAAVGAMLCLLAIDLRLESFYFNVGDFQPYSTIRHLGMLDSNNMLADDNVYYRDIDLDCVDFALDPDSYFQLRGPLRLGFRQLDNPRWPASPLYTLTITDAALARKLAGDAVISLRLVITGNGEQGAEGVSIAEARLADGTPVPADSLQLKLNTLAASASGATHYWIDSGSIYQQ